MLLKKETKLHTNMFISTNQPSIGHSWASMQENLTTVNSEIFAKLYFSRNFAYVKFRENKTLAKWQNHSVIY